MMHSFLIAAFVLLGGALSLAFIGSALRPRPDDPYAIAFGDQPETPPHAATRCGNESLAHCHPLVPSGGERAAAGRPVRRSHGGCTHGEAGMYAGLPPVTSRSGA